MAANRKIITAMSMLLVAIFASVSVTFAWFSTNTQSTAIFTLTIQSGLDSLFIKVDKDVNAEGIDKDRVDDYSGRRVVLQDLTLTDKNGKWQLLYENGATANPGDYILQQYTFYTNNPNKSVYLMTSGNEPSSVISDGRVRTFSGSEKTYWLQEGKKDEKIAGFFGTTDPDKTNDENTTVVIGEGTAGETVYYFNSNGYYNTKAANAVRVMTYPGEVQGIPENAPAFIWDPNPDSGYDIKNENGGYVYDQISSYFRNTLASDKVSVNRSDASNIVDYLTSGEDTAVIPSTLWREVPSSADDYHENVPHRATITLVLWLEGKDADCFNAISGDTVNANFKFVLA